MNRDLFMSLRSRHRDVGSNMVIQADTVWCLHPSTWLCGQCRWRNKTWRVVLNIMLQGALRLGCAFWCRSVESTMAYTPSTSFLMVGSGESLSTISLPIFIMMRLPDSFSRSQPYPTMSSHGTKAPKLSIYAIFWQLFSGLLAKLSTQFLMHGLLT